VLMSLMVLVLMCINRLGNQVWSFGVHFSWFIVQFSSQNFMRSRSALEVLSRLDTMADGAVSAGGLTIGRLLREQKVFEVE